MTNDAILERLKNRFTTPYYTEDGSNIDKLMRVRTTEIDEVSGVLDDITAAHHLPDATGDALDQWGSLLQVPRDTSESDTRYRTRLLTWVMIYRGCGTLGDIVNTIITVLGCDPSTVMIEENYMETL